MFLSAITGTVLKCVGEFDSAFRREKDLNTSNLRSFEVSDSWENTENEGSKIPLEFYRAA